MNQRDNVTSSTASERVETISSDNNVISISEGTTVQEINRNKPWRSVIRRVVSDGRSDYEDIPGGDGNS